MINDKSALIKYRGTIFGINTPTENMQEERYLTEGR